MRGPRNWLSIESLDLPDRLLLLAVVVLPWAFGGVEIWAFRSAMMDFLVKPLSGEDLDRWYATLKQKCDSRRKQKGRGISKSEQLLPTSAVSHSKEPDLEPALCEFSSRVSEILEILPIKD